MSILPQDVFNAAYAKSKKNQPGRIANEAVELLGECNRMVRLFFMYGVRVNPFYYMDTDDVTFSSGWARPSEAESIYWIEFTSGGAEVITVPLNDKEAETGKPAVYRQGQVFQGAGNTLDPTNEELTFFFSKRSTDSSDKDSDPIDELFPDSFKELLVLEIALYLAIKDGREGDVAGLVAQRDRWLLMYLAHLEHETMNVVSRWGPPQPFNTSSMIALGTMLQGGTTVEG